MKIAPRRQKTGVEMQGRVVESWKTETLHDIPQSLELSAVLISLMILMYIACSWSREHPKTREKTKGKSDRNITVCSQLSPDSRSLAFREAASHTSVIAVIHEVGCRDIKLNSQLRQSKIQY